MPSPDQKDGVPEVSSSEREVRRCPDDGYCHHDCTVAECFRVRTCEPMGRNASGWTTEEKHRYGQQHCNRVEDALIKAAHESEV